MLILSRRVGETVVLTLPGGQLISVVVTGNKYGVVKLGFAAPRDVVVDRV